MTREVEDATHEFDEVLKDGVRLFNKFVVVYVDGACTGNGKNDRPSVGGVGIFFGPRCQLNVSEKVPSNFRPHTNNDAELYAAYRASSICRKQGFFKVELRTDSQLIVDYFTITRKNRLSKSSLADFEQRPNDYAYLQVESAISVLKEVMLTKVRAHKSDVGNIQADILAKQAVLEE